jgi:hypothetical protein
LSGNKEFKDKSTGKSEGGETKNTRIEEANEMIHRCLQAGDDPANSRRKE